MAQFSNGDLAPSITIIWSELLLQVRWADMVLTDFVTDFSEYVSEEGDTVRIPDLYTNKFTANTIAPGSDILAAATLQNPAQVQKTLSININIGISFLITRQTEAQLKKSYSLLEKYVYEGSQTISAYLESNLFGLVNSGITNQILPAGAYSTTSGLSDDQIRNALSYMEGSGTTGAAPITADPNNSYPADETAFFFSPAVFYSQISGISKISANYSSNLNLIKTGTFGMAEGTMDMISGNERATAGARMQYKGMLYGRRVYTSPYVATATVSTVPSYINVLLHKEAICFACQNGMKLGGNNSEDMVMGGPMSKVYIEVFWYPRFQAYCAYMSLQFGSAVMRATAGIKLPSSTTALTQ